MATPDDVVRIQYIAEIAKLKAQLAEIPDATGKAAKATAAKIADLNKKLAAMSKTTVTGAGAATKSMGQLGNVSRSVAQQLPDVWVQLQGGVDASTVLSQQGLQVVQSNMGAFLGAAKAAAAFMSGPWGLALAAGAAAVSVIAVAYMDATEESRQMEQTLEATNEALKPELIMAAARSWESLGAITHDVQTQIALLNGTMTQADAGLIKRIALIKEETTAGLLALGAVKAKLIIRQQELQAQLKGNDLNVQERLSKQQLLDSTKEGIVVAEQVLQGRKNEIAATEREAVELWALQEAKEADVKNTRAVTVVVKEQIDVLAGLKEANQASFEVLGQIAAISARAGEDQISMGDAVIANMTEQLNGIQKIADLYGELPGLAEARLEVEARATRDLADLNRQLAERYMSDQQRALDADLAAIQTRKQQGLTAASTFLGGLSSLAAAAAEAQANATGKAAEGLVAFAKTAGIAQIAINTAVAITQALAQLGPIAGAIAAVGITGVGIAQAAIVAGTDTPVFHTGGLAPDERSAVVQPGEAVLTREAVKNAGGEEGINRQNRGEVQQQAPVYLQLGHKIFGEAYKQVSGLARNPVRDSIRRQTGALAGVR